jgi:hypothetical protein
MVILFFYITFSGNCGLGGGYGINAGTIAPTSERGFQVEDWAGCSNSYSLSAQVEPVGVGGTHEGMEADGSRDKKTRFQNMVQAKTGYTTTSGSSAKLSIGLKLDAFISKPIIWTF